MTVNLPFCKMLLEANVRFSELPSPSVTFVRFSFSKILPRTSFMDNKWQLKFIPGEIAKLQYNISDTIRLNYKKVRKKISSSLLISHEKMFYLWTIVANKFKMFHFDAHTLLIVPTIINLSRTVSTEYETNHNVPSH